MANPNYWSDRDRTNSGGGDDDERPPYRPISVPAEVAPPPVQAPEQGIIFHRMPLPPEVVQPAISLGRSEKAEEDDDDEEDESQEPTTRQQSTPPVAVGTARVAYPEHAATDTDDTIEEATNTPVHIAPVDPLPQAQPRTNENIVLAQEAATANTVDEDEDTAVATPTGTVPVAAVHQTPASPTAAPEAAEWNSLLQHVPEATPAPETAVAEQSVSVPPEAWAAEQTTPLTYAPAEQAIYADQAVAPEQPLSERPGFGGATAMPTIQRFASPNQFVPPLAPSAEQFAYGQGEQQSVFIPDGGSPYMYNQAPGVSSVPAEQAPEVVEVRDRRLVPTVLTAVGFEYFARKRADRKLEKRVTKAAEQNQRETEQAHKQFANQQREYAEQQQRQTIDMREMRSAQERMAATPLTYAEQSPSPLQVEQRPLPPIARAPEFRSPITPQEQVPVVIMPQQEQAPEPEHTHEMQDAWRRYVVDEHNREVTTARTYGEAYHQERQQEIIRDHAADNTGSDAAGAGAYGMGLGPQGAMPGPALPSGMTTPSLPQGTPTHVDPQHQLEEGSKKQQIESNVTNPWFWLMLALIVGAFFTAALI